MISDDAAWIVNESDEAVVRRLVEEAGVPSVIARILAARGVSTADEAAEFLNPSLAHLHDPSLLPDLDKGVEIVAAAIESGSRICVHGDYDVDGVTSAALLVRTLRALKADVEFRLPHRRKEGYDIKPASVDEAAANGVKLIITCDCGINAIKTVEHANELGIDVVITDHHEPGPELPPARAIINPKRHDATYPFDGLAGVGVAFKFAQGLVRKLGYNEDSFMKRFVDLAALGTVADVVPLVGENRAIVKQGLAAIRDSKKLGLQTMLKATNLAGRPMTAYYLAFVLGPRINSVGRMDDASRALQLLLTNDPAEASALAEEMERFNSERRAEQERILAEALAQVESKDLSSTNVLVLSNEGWNAGVVGIVAGKICEQYGRPTLLISRDEATGIGSGSARSIEAFNMLEGLHQCREILGRYGGHALAAGLSIPLANIEEFERRMNALAAEVIGEPEMGPRIVLDAELSASDVTRELADGIALLEPFGMGNPEPLFVTRNLAVISRHTVGQGAHLKMLLEGNGVGPLACIAFGMGDLVDSIETGQSIDLCYHVRVNAFNGSETVQLVGKAIRL